MVSELLTRRGLLKQGCGIALAGGLASTSLISCSPSPCDVPLRPSRKKSTPIEIVWASEDGDDSFYKKLADIFSKSNSYKITVKQYNEQNHDRLLKSLLHCGEKNASPIPDVFSIDVIWVKEFVDHKVAMKLCDRWSVTERNQYASVPMQAVTINGEVYAAPFRTDLGLLYYLTDVTTTPPATWDELFHQALAAKEKRKTTYGYVWQGGKGVRGGRPFGEGLVCNYLEVLYNYNGVFNLDDPQTLTSDEAVHALEDMVRWVGTISPQDITTYDEDTSLNTWKQGSAAFMRNWPYGYAEGQLLKESAVAGKFKVASLPNGGTKKDQIGRSCLGGWCLAINDKIEDEDRKDAAWQFVYWMMQETAQKIAAKEMGWLVTLRTLYEHPSQDLRDAYPYFDTGQISVATLLDNAILRPTHKRYTALSSLIQEHLHQALERKVKPQQALQNLRESIDQFKPEEVDPCK